MRAILTAPIARDLFTIYGYCVRIPDATNGVLQAWDTINADLFSNDTQVSIYTSRAAVPNILKPYLIQLERSDSSTQWTNRRWVRYADLSSATYSWRDASATTIQVRDWVQAVNSGVTRATLKSGVTAGDVPANWDAVHYWYNVADDLGNTS